MLLRLYGLWTLLWLRSQGVRRREVDALGYRVVVHDLGPIEAPPWLLLHGLGATAASWLGLLRARRRRNRLLTVELSALGGSRGPYASIRLQDASRVLAAVLDALHVDRPLTVAGMSLGGWMAVRLALAEPAIVERLVLIDSAGWRDQDWEKVRSLVSLGSRSDVDRLYRVLFVRTPALLRWSRGLFYKAYTSAAVRTILETTRPDDAFGAAELERLSLPVGLVWGEHDGLFPVSVAREMASALACSHLEVVTGCGHGLHWECPKRFVAAVERAATFAGPSVPPTQE